jgi:hypothetical protein
MATPLLRQNISQYDTNHGGALQEYSSKRNTVHRRTMGEEIDCQHMVDHAQIVEQKK